MLGTEPMRSLLALALVAATPVAASAGTYLGLGIGTQASGHIGSDPSSMETDGNHSGRLILGMRFGRLSAEGSGTRYSEVFRNASSPSTSLAVALKYGLPLGDNFEIFGRGGLQRTWVSGADWDLAGNGWLLGAGFEYRIDAALTGLSVFVDYTHNQSTLYGPSNVPLDASASMWTLGATLAI